MSPKDAEGLAHGADANQTVLQEQFESSLFAQTCLPKNLKSLQYVKNIVI